jgi:hypothetical protein
MKIYYEAQSCNGLIVQCGSIVKLDILALAASIKELTAGSRKARTGMWCALGVTLLTQEQEEESKKSKVTGVADAGAASAAPAANSVVNTSAMSATTAASDTTAGQTGGLQNN